MMVSQLAENLELPRVDCLAGQTEQTMAGYSGSHSAVRSVSSSDTNSEPTTVDHSEKNLVDRTVLSKAELKGRKMVVQMDSLTAVMKELHSAYSTADH